MKRGYTLLEILVVLAVVVLLILVALPNMTGFVSTSKQESALANAAAIYTIADNYIYEDIYLHNNDTFGCRNGCVIESDTFDPNYRKLIELIDMEIPKSDGMYILTILPGGNLQVEFRFPDDISGTYPKTVSYIDTSSRRVVTQPVITGTYPRVSSITTNITTRITNPVSTSLGIYIYDTGIPTNSIWPDAIKPWPTRHKGDTFKVNGKFWLVTQRNITINDSHSTPASHPQVIEINNVMIRQTSLNPITHRDQYGNVVTSIQIGDILFWDDSYYVCIKNNARIRYPLNSSHWIKLE